MNNLAFDLGTSEVRVVKEGKLVETISFSAETMENRQKQIIQKGKIITIRAFEDFILPIIKRHYNRKFIFGPRFTILTSVTSDYNQVTIRGIRDCFMLKGSSMNYLIPDTFLICAGVGIDYHKTKGITIVDIGAGKTTITTIKKGKIIFNDILDFSGNTIDENIYFNIKRNHSITLDLKSIENIKQKYIKVDNDNNQLIRDVENLKVTTEELNSYVKNEIDLLIDKIDYHIAQLDIDLRKEIERTGLLITGKSKNIEGLLDKFSQKYSLHPKSYFNENWIVEGMKIFQKDFDKFTEELIM